MFYQARFVVYTSMALCLALPTKAEPTIPELDERLRGVEANVEAILELLQAQQAEGRAPSVDTASSVIPSAYQWGKLYLDAFSNPMNGEEANAILTGKKDVPDRAEGAPLVSVQRKAEEAFSWGVLLEEPATSSHANAEGNLQLVWSGSFLVEKDGSHTFVLNLERTAGKLGPGACRAILKLNQEPVIDLRMRAEIDMRFIGYNRYEPFNVNEQAEIELARGVYDFSLFLTCLANRSDAMKGTMATLRLMEPGDRAPEPISPDRFGIGL